MKYGWFEAFATASLVKKGFSFWVFKILGFFKHSKLTNLDTGRMATLMKAQMCKKD